MVRTFLLLGSERNLQMCVGAGAIENSASQRSAGHTVDESRLTKLAAIIKHRFFECNYSHF